MRVFAAESLGRMRAREAVRPLSDLVARERDPDVRDRYCDALSRIGDAGAVPALRTAAAAADARLRDGALAALSRIGGAPERAVVQAAEQRACAVGLRRGPQGRVRGHARAARRRGGVRRGSGLLGG